MIMVRVEFAYVVLDKIRYEVTYVVIQANYRASLEPLWAVSHR